MIRKEDLNIVSKYHPLYPPAFSFSEYMIEAVIRNSFTIDSTMIELGKAPPTGYVQQRLYDEMFYYLYGEIFEYLTKRKRDDIVRSNPICYSELRKIMQFIFDEWNRKTNKKTQGKIQI